MGCASTFLSAAIGVLWLSSPSAAFLLSPPSPSSLALPTATTALFATAAESEAEALLRKARELKAAAAEAEQSLHSSLLDKKAKRDGETDKMIDSLFPPDGAAEGDVDRLRSRRPSTDMLVRIVERLHEREVEALGLEHVEPSAHHDHTTFRVVRSSVDDAEVRRVSGLIDRLVEAASVLDEEWARERQARGKHHRTHVEATHWTAGDVAKILGDKARDLRREHDDGFKKRQSEYYEAARRKDRKDDLKP